jgi:hypothetical protein
MTLLGAALTIACARPSPPATPSASTAAVVPTTVAAAADSTTEQRFTAKKGAVVITISNQPGAIVDSTAPPPPPGSPVPPNPYLSATCAGDALGCSEAGTLLRGTRSAQEFVNALRKVGFEVTNR